MTDGLISLLVQIPLVAAFMWFVLQIMSKHDTALKARETEWRMFMETRDKAFETLLYQMSNQHDDALGRLAEEIKALALLTTATNALIVRQDRL